MNLRRLKRVLACWGVLGLIGTSGSGVAHADLVFSLNFTPQAQADLSAAQQGLFADALGYWDDWIIGHRDGVNRTWQLTVDTFSQPAATGGGVLLGYGGYSALALTNVVPGAHTSDGRFYISTAGQVTFNVHPDAGSLAANLILHEIAHALGFGSLWELNQVYNDGVAGNTFRTLVGGQPGQYVGSAALAAYRQEFVGQSAATFVPVELAGGAGTAHGHWNEQDNFGQALTGIVDSLGRDMRDELMTGWSSPTGNVFVSQTTVQSLVDIGFTVRAVPEPAAGLGQVLVAAVGLLFCRRRAAAARTGELSVIP